MFKLLTLTLIAASIAACAASDLGEPSPAQEAIPAFDPNAPEPITGEPVRPNPGDETQVKDPFEPYGIGGPEAAIPRSHLSRAEQDALDRTHNLDAKTLEAYRQAVLQRSRAVTATVAAHQLGVDNLARVGVLP